MCGHWEPPATLNAPQGVVGISRCLATPSTRLSRRGERSSTPLSPRSSQCGWLPPPGGACGSPGRRAAFKLNRPMTTSRYATCGECGGNTIAPAAETSRPAGVCSRCWRQTPEYRALQAVRRSARYTRDHEYRELENTRARTRYERRLRGLCLECGGRTRPPQVGVPRPLGLCASCWRLTPEFRERDRQRKRESYRNDEALAERTRVRTSDRYRRLTDNEPEFGERERERQRRRWAGDPEYRAQRAARRRQRYASEPEFRESERHRKREGRGGP